MEPRGQFGQGHLLQSDKPGSQLQRAAGARIGPDVPVKVGSGQNDDQGKFGMIGVKVLNGLGAAARVQRDHNVTALSFIALTQHYAMAELPQNARPSDCGNPVTVVETKRRGSDELDLHPLYFAQVRNPAQISRRSEV